MTDAVVDITDGEAKQLCRRCEDAPVAIVVRTEPLCEQCFIRYIRTKTVKRMEAFRPKLREAGQERKLLVPISFGVSSVVLLQILDAQLANQKEKTGRYGYDLILLHVRDSAQKDQADYPQLIQDIQRRFHRHPIHIDYVPDDLKLTSGNTSVDVQSSKSTQQVSLATGQRDVQNLLRTRTIVDFAVSHNCEGILWGDCTTRLAERTISETAKGRGFALPWNVSDGAHPSGVSFVYPLRDVLKKELMAYSEMIDPPLTSLIVVPPKIPSAITKNTTIDDLMTNYFESVEENFPSIVANVVRTTSRLDAPKIKEDARLCDLCKMPVLDERFGIHGWGGDQGDNEQAADKKPAQLCYGCTRSAPT